MTFAISLSTESGDKYSYFIESEDSVSIVIEEMIRKEINKLEHLL